MHGFISLSDKTSCMIKITISFFYFFLLVFLVTSHGDLLRKIALKAMQMGINRGEYSIIYYLSDPISTYIGNYQWQRGDDYDLVRAQQENTFGPISDVSETPLEWRFADGR